MLVQLFAFFLRLLDALCWPHDVINITIARSGGVIRERAAAGDEDAAMLCMMLWRASFLRKTPKCHRHVIVEKRVKSVMDDDGIQVGCFVGQMKVTCQAKNTHCSLLYTTLIVHFELRYATNFVYELLDSPLSMQSFTKMSVLPYRGRLVISSVKVYMPFNMLQQFLDVSFAGTALTARLRI